MTAVAANVKFYQLCAALEKIQKKQGNINKKNVLSEFISDWRKYHAELHKGKISVRTGLFVLVRSRCALRKTPCKRQVQVD